MASNGSDALMEQPMAKAAKVEAPGTASGPPSAPAPAGWTKAPVPPPKGTPPQQPGLCRFWLPKKRRFCKYALVPGNPDAQYCHTHQAEIGEEGKGERVPCPLNPSHTVYAKDVERHVKVCPDRLTDPAQYAFYSKGLHTAGPGAPDGDGAEVRVSHAAASKEELDVFCTKVRAKFTSLVESGELKIVRLGTAKESVANELVRGAGQDLGLPELDAYCASHTEKHAVQESSILAVVEHFGALRAHAAKGHPFVEFGAGKGGLSYALRRAVPDSKVYVVDRGGFRRKRDGAVRNESVPFVRLRIDIADLDLAKVDELPSASKCVAVGKHLCGGCTDFALRCLASSSHSHSFPFVAIATCCHQLCSYGTHSDPSALADFTKTEFAYLCSVSSWAVCGKVTAEREEIGYMCKRLLDYGRLVRMRALGYTDVAELWEYTTHDRSKENVMLVCRKPDVTAPPTEQSP